MAVTRNVPDPIADKNTRTEDVTPTATTCKATTRPPTIRSPSPVHPNRSAAVAAAGEGEEGPEGRGCPSTR